MKVTKMRNYTQTLPVIQWKELKVRADKVGVTVSEYVRSTVIPRFLEFDNRLMKVEEALKRGSA
jgi:hypothetical protein